MHKISTYRRLDGWYANVEAGPLDQFLASFGPEETEEEAKRRAEAWSAANPKR